MNELRPRLVALQYHLLALLLALLGGVLGIIGAFVQALPSGGGILPSRP